jgi:hypothetical protein
MACLIIQKQLEYIDGKKENIVVPSKKMRQIRTQNGQFVILILINHIYLFYRSSSL